MLLKSATNGNVTTNVTVLPTTETGAYLVAGNLPCIGVQLVDRAVRTDGTYTPAHIKLVAHATNVTRGVCQQVRNSQVVNDYFSSTVSTGTGEGATPIANAIPIGSSKGIYGARTGT